MSAGQPSLEIPRSLNRIDDRALLKGDVVSCRFHQSFLTCGRMRCPVPCRILDDPGGSLLGIQREFAESTALMRSRSSDKTSGSILLKTWSCSSPVHPWASSHNLGSAASGLQPSSETRRILPRASTPDARFWRLSCGTCLDFLHESLFLRNHLRSDSSPKRSLIISSNRFMPSPTREIARLLLHSLNTFLGTYIFVGVPCRACSGYRPTACAIASLARKE